MATLPEVVPDVEIVLCLEPEELAAKLLFVFAAPSPHRSQGMVHLGNLLGECFGEFGQGARYPSEKRRAVYIALAEAWSWLEAQGLLIPADESNGRNGYRTLSRRALKFESEQDFSSFVAARNLPKETLHPSIRTTVWAAFVRGEYDVAVFQAMKTVEVRVREAASLPDTLLGVRLMRAAFTSRTGPLTDTGTDEGEQVARMELFAGTIGSYKNPHSHRDVKLQDPAEAIEIVLLANHLLRIVDARCTRASV